MALGGAEHVIATQLFALFLAQTVVDIFGSLELAFVSPSQSTLSTPSISSTSTSQFTEERKNVMGSKLEKFYVGVCQGRTHISGSLRPKRRSDSLGDDWVDTTRQEQTIKNRQEQTMSHDVKTEDDLIDLVNSIIETITNLTI